MKIYFKALIDPFKCHRFGAYKYGICIRHLAMCSTYQVPKEDWFSLSIIFFFWSGFGSHTAMFSIVFCFPQQSYVYVVAADDCNFSGWRGEIGWWYSVCYTPHLRQIQEAKKPPEIWHVLQCWPYLGVSETPNLKILSQQWRPGGPLLRPCIQFKTLNKLRMKK